MLTKCHATLWIKRIQYRYCKVWNSKTEMSCSWSASRICMRKAFNFIKNGHKAFNCYARRVHSRLKKGWREDECCTFCTRQHLPIQVPSTQGRTTIGAGGGEGACNPTFKLWGGQGGQFKYLTSHFQTVGGQGGVQVKMWTDNNL